MSKRKHFTSCFPDQTMNGELPFLGGVVILLRLLYFAVDSHLQRSTQTWNAEKRRFFTVRVVSLTHATISGICTLTGCYIYPELWADPYGFSCHYGRLVALFSMGLILTTGVLLGLAMICLLVEVQTVFIHIRTILRLFGKYRSNSRLYRVVMHCNLGSLVLFRHIPATYLLFYISFLEKQAPAVLRLFLISALLFLAYHNFHLQQCFLKMDGYFGNASDEYEDQLIDPLDNTPIGNLLIKEESYDK
ncbi:unnamed protein product [Enterobius vermicularis]|uniref:G_PROTEIN_RECEP_F1_2 domain-containing protein n=1 Tax=Enterobius vermicularis TaxID=51028 RepID=A0A0N4VK55_ENTVE|nr:unnamed protein product [Enterobius vermicularis]